jgi:capsid portal protein
MNLVKLPQLSTVAATLVLVAGAVALPAGAGSLVTSSAAGGSSASSAASSASESSKDSSTSSSTNKRVAEGPYKIVDMVAVADRPGTMRLRLQALADAGAAGDTGEFVLDLPALTVDQSRLASGQTVIARQRAYGTEFAHGDSHQAFFLVLSDGWSRELVSNPVLL